MGLPDGGPNDPWPSGRKSGPWCRLYPWGRHCRVNAYETKPQIPADIEEHRDEHWRREETGRVETAFEAERFIEQVGFAA